MMPSAHPIREVYRASIRHALGASQIVEFKDGLLAIDNEGKIAACDAFEKLSPRLPKDCMVHDLRGSWIIPGFVDCHVHLPQLDCRNKNGLTLLDWLNKYIYPAEAQFADPKMVQKIAPRFYDELLSHGITTAAIHSTVHFEATDIAFNIANDKGLRVVMGQVLMDQNAPENLLRPAIQLLRETEKLMKKWHGKNGKLFYGVTPRFALTCSEGLLLEAGRLAENSKVYFQTHLAETIKEVEQAKDIHHFKNYAAFYEDQHCLSPHSLFAHCIYLNDEELKILSGYQCSMSHCPTSNVFLKSGTMPIGKIKQHNIRCGLGTDVGAGPTFSMREVISCSLEVHPKNEMDEKRGFYMATLGGAEALSLSDQIGNFMEGKWADFAVFDNSECAGLAEQSYVAGKLVWSASNGS
ncbi:MAG: guanine deaminase [Deltaproteobacteria bacterium]|nr:guanine deaminase [Deltaproteobacteria bacterium]